MKIPGDNQDTLVAKIVAALDGLACDDSITLHQADDPFDPTEGARVGVNGAYVVLVDTSETRGAQAHEPAPCEQWFASMAVTVTVATARHVRRDVQRDNLYLVSRAVIDTLDKALVGRYPLDSRSLPRPVAWPGKEDFFKHVVSFRAYAPWKRSDW